MDTSPSSKNVTVITPEVDLAPYFFKHWNLWYSQPWKTMKSVWYSVIPVLSLM